MNDEPSSSSASHQAPPPDSYNDAGSDALPTAADLAYRRKRNRENFNKRRGELLEDLLRNLDILVYTELSAIYYMDCSFIRFFVRSIVQFFFLSPKPAIFPAQPANRPYIGAIFGSGLLCLLLHLIFAAPSATEATRGYLHGGLAMDFIGQKGPTSKSHLFLLDCIVLILQVVQLGVHVLRLRLREDAAAAAPIRVVTSDGSQYGAGQDLDDEERGIRRSTDVREDIEMHTLNLADAVAEREDNEASLESSSAPQRTDAHIFDAFNSGQIVIADIDLAKIAEEQFWLYQKSAREEHERTSEVNRTIRERLARRMLTWRIDGGRELGA